MSSTAERDAATRFRDHSDEPEVASVIEQFGPPPRVSRYVPDYEALLGRVPHDVWGLWRRGSFQSRIRELNAMAWLRWVAEAYPSWKSFADATGAVANTLFTKRKGAAFGVRNGGYMVTQTYRTLCREAGVDVAQPSLVGEELFLGRVLFAANLLLGGSLNGLSREAGIPPPYLRGVAVGRHGISPERKARLVEFLETHGLPERWTRDGLGELPQSVLNLPTLSD